MDNWVQFDALEFLDRKSWPRVISRRFYEINPLGQVRYLDRKKMENVYCKVATYKGNPYFMAVVGWVLGNLVVVRIPVKDLVKRFFNH